MSPAGRRPRLPGWRDEPIADERRPTCGRCGWRLSRATGRCTRCPRPPDDEDAAVVSPVEHRVEVVCLTCARPATLADARAGAGRCRACGGTLVLNRVP